MNFTHYHCQNGFAKPVNSYPEFGVDSQQNPYLNDYYFKFETFARANTISCIEDLSGNYKVEDCEIVWQCRLRGSIVWHEALPEARERSNNDFNHYRDYCDYMGAYARQYLQLKPVVKEESAGVKKRYTGITDALFDQYVKDTISEYIMVNSFHCECPKCGEKYDVTPADGTAINKKVTEPEVKQQFGEWIMVKDELPTKDGEYNVCYEMPNKKWHVFTTGYSTSFKRFDFGSSNITHWQPLPSPPKSI